MNFADFLDERLILPEMSASSKEEALRELVASLPAVFSDLDTEDIVQTLLEREELGSTGIGSHVAIPHGKFGCLEKTVLVAGRSRTGLDFASIDAKPVHIFFLVLAPEDGYGTHLRLLARIANIARDEGFRQSFMECADAQEIQQLLLIGLSNSF